MIVIATNNGHRLLSSLLKSIETWDGSNKRILIVDTHSTNPESISFLATLSNYKGPLQLQVVQTPWKNGYEVGAYLYAFRNFPDDSYLFLHDGMLARSSEWYSQFEQRWSAETPVVPWITFSPLLMGCHTGHVEFLMQHFGNCDWPRWGIFGSIFFSSRDALVRTEQAGYLHEGTLPRSKTGAEGMERGFSVAFFNAGIRLNPVHQGIDLERVHAGEYPHLQKIFGGRT